MTAPSTLPAGRATAAPVLFHVVLLAFAVGHARASDVPGFTEPSRDLKLAAAETGRIAAVEVREGDVVSAGQVIARTDVTILEASRRITDAQIAAEGKLNRARAELRMQAERLAKLKALLGRNHAGQEEVDRATIDHEVAAAALLTAEEEQAVRKIERERIDAQIEDRFVRSPIDGTVVRVTKDVGEFVSPADPVVARVVQLNPLTALFPVPERMAEAVRRGEAAAVLFPRTGRMAEGTVEFVSPVVDPQSGTVRVKVTLENGAGDLRAGEKCVLSVDFTEQVAAAEEAEDF